MSEWSFLLSFDLAFVLWPPFEHFPYLDHFSSFQTQPSKVQCLYFPMVPMSHVHLNTLFSKSGTVSPISGSSCPGFAPLSILVCRWKGQVGALWSFPHVFQSSCRDKGVWHGGRHVSSNELAVSGGDSHIQPLKEPYTACTVLAPVFM